MFQLSIIPTGELKDWQLCASKQEIDRAVSFAKSILDETIRLL